MSEDSKPQRIVTDAAKWSSKPRAGWLYDGVDYPAFLAVQLRDDQVEEIGRIDEDREQCKTVKEFKDLLVKHIRTFVPTAPDLIERESLESLYGYLAGLMSAGLPEDTALEGGSGTASSPRPTKRRKKSGSRRATSA